MNDKNQNQKIHIKSTFSLYEKYKSEFIDCSEDILNKKESDFLNSFYQKMNLICIEEFGDNVFEDQKFVSSMKECERNIYQYLYKPMYSHCQNTINNFTRSNTKQTQSKQKEPLYLSNFRPHCCYNQIPIHTCKGRFITVNDITNNSKTLYVICINCKKCYFESSILMLCVNCKKPFYSSIISTIDKQLPPATWEKYHCNAMRNEQMSCINCHDKFWLKNSNLYCKTCKTFISPLEIDWKCVICHKIFKSGAKPYNPLEFKIIKIAKENALLYKRVCKPKETPCNCFKNENIDYYIFCHSSACKGVMYFGRSADKDIVVCSLCNIVATLNKFQWECPICNITFINKKVKVYPNENDNDFDKRGSMSDKDSSTTGITSNDRMICKSLILNHNQIDYSNNQNLKESNDKIEINKIRNIGSLLFEQNNPHSSNLNLKDRNLSINLMNKPKIKHRKNLSNVINCERYLELEMDKEEESEIKNEDSSVNEKLKVHLIRKNKKGSAFNKNPEKKISKQQILLIESQRCNSNENREQDNQQQDKNSNITNTKKNSVLSCVSSSSNIYKSDNNTINNNKENYRSIQVFLQKRSSNLSDSKNNKSNPNTNILLRSSESESKDNILGKNRFKIQYESPNIEKRKDQVVMFNSDEKEQRDKIKNFKKTLINENRPDKLLNNSNNKARNNRNMSSNIKKRNNEEHEELEINSISINKNGQISKKYDIKTTPILANNSSSINIHGKMTINSNKSSNEKINFITNEKNQQKKSLKSNRELKEFNIENYSIITQLGQGTFGKIYLVQDTNKNIYSMKKIILNEELDLEGIVKEYQLVHRLQHRNIIEILGCYTAKLDLTTFVIYILMEVGLTDWEKEIKSHIEKRDYYSEKELCNILHQLISALSFLQNENVSHRDVKPQNVLIFKNNLYKIADFGEAKEITTSGNKQISTLRGTELYMSPLLYNGLKTNQLDIKHNLFKSDVYSLGLCILFAATLTQNTITEVRKFVDMKNVRIFLMKVLSQQYSQMFINLLGDMLEINERYRPDFLELSTKI